jgi:cyclic pyranopterin phosphate synthase
VVDIVRAAASLGVKAIRLTGGEPLLRPRVWELVERIVNIGEIEEVALTTNGVLLVDQADALAAAGLRRVNISLDTTDAEEYRRIAGQDALSCVLDAIDAARAARLHPVKVNAVIGLSRDWERQMLSLAQLAVERKVYVRFIERMPTVGDDRPFRPDVDAPYRALERMFDLTPATGPPGSGPARYFDINGGQGTIGLICPMSAPFCPTCNRLRLTARGLLRPCLLSENSIDLRQALCLPPLARHTSLRRAFRLAALAKPRSHASLTEAHVGDMAHIGG